MQIFNLLTSKWLLFQLMMGDLHLEVPEPGVADPEPIVLKEEAVQWTKDYGPSMLRRAKHPSLSSSSQGSMFILGDALRIDLQV